MRFHLVLAHRAKQDKYSNERTNERERREQLKLMTIFIGNHIFAVSLAVALLLRLVPLEVVVVVVVCLSLHHSTAAANNTTSKVSESETPPSFTATVVVAAAAAASFQRELSTRERRHLGVCSKRARIELLL